MTTPEPKNPNAKEYNPLAPENLGRANVYKTIKVLQDDGTGAEIDFGYRIKQFKCRNGCEHHNHLVCVICQQYSYLDNVVLEDLQDKLAKQNSFVPKKHNFQIFGICKNCR